MRGEFMLNDRWPRRPTISKNVLLTRRVKRDDIVDIRLIFCIHTNRYSSITRTSQSQIYIEDGVDVSERSH